MNGSVANVRPSSSSPVSPTLHPNPNPHSEDGHGGMGKKEREWRIGKRWGGWRGLGYGDRLANGRGSARGWSCVAVGAAVSLRPLVSAAVNEVGEGAVGVYDGVVGVGGGLRGAVVSNAQTHEQMEEEGK